MTPTLGPDWGVGDVFVDRFYSGFAQLEVVLPEALLSVVGVAALVMAGLAVVGLVVHRGALARRRDVAIVCAIAAVGYLLLIHAVAFRGLLDAPDPAITGRYLLPLIPLYGAGIALAVSWLGRWAGVVVLGRADVAAARRLRRAVREVLCVGSSLLWGSCCSLPRRSPGACRS